MTADEDPSPEPADGMSASVVISTPLVTPVIRMASRTSSCSRSSTWETISFVGVVDVDVVVEALLHYDVDVLVDGGVQDPAAVFPVVAGQVGASAEQADAQWRLGDNHRPARTGQSWEACRYASMVPMSRKYPSTGTARARPTRRGSRW